MCIICIKPMGVSVPSTQTLNNMYWNNSDGAGLMYHKDGRVVIEKGFMKYDAFETRLAELENEIDTLNTTIIFHFRITTSGGSKPQNTHPFPVSGVLKELQKLRTETSLGVAHNGIIDITHPIDVSDTMTYIKNELSYLYQNVPAFYDNEGLMEMIKHRIGSKLAFLLPDGTFRTVGTFETSGGCIYSNATYKSGRANYYSYGWGSYDDYDDAYDRWKTSGKTQVFKWARQIAGTYKRVDAETVLLQDMIEDYISRHAKRDEVYFNSKRTKLFDYGNIDLEKLKEDGAEISGHEWIRIGYLGLADMQKAFGEYAQDDIELLYLKPDTMTFVEAYLDCTGNLMGLIANDGWDTDYVQRMADGEIIDDGIIPMIEPCDYFNLDIDDKPFESAGAEKHKSATTTHKNIEKYDEFGSTQKPLVELYELMDNPSQDDKVMAELSDGTLKELDILDVMYGYVMMDKNFNVYEYDEYYKLFEPTIQKAKRVFVINSMGTEQNLVYDALKEDTVWVW